MKATLANNEDYSGLAIRQTADTGRRWWKGHDGRLQKRVPQDEEHESSMLVRQ